jgi:hypothetical protein
MDNRKNNVQPSPSDIASGAAPPSSDPGWQGQRHPSPASGASSAIKDLTIQHGQDGRQKDPNSEVDEHVLQTYKSFFCDNLYIVLIALGFAVNIAEWLTIVFLVYGIDRHVKEPKRYAKDAWAGVFLGSLAIFVPVIFGFVYFVKRDTLPKHHSMSIKQIWVEFS